MQAERILEDSRGRDGFPGEAAGIHTVAPPPSPRGAQSCPHSGSDGGLPGLTAWLGWAHGHPPGSGPQGCAGEGRGPKAGSRAVLLGVRGAEDGSCWGVGRIVADCGQEVSPAAHRPWEVRLSSLSGVESPRLLHVASTALGVSVHFSVCVTLGKLLSLSGPCAPHPSVRLMMALPACGCDEE